MGGNADPHPRGRISWNPGVVVTLVLAAIALVFAAFEQSAATASPFNCGELPGITRIGTMVFGVGIAVVVGVAGAIAAAVVKEVRFFWAGATIGLGIVAGLVIGSGLATRPVC